jgi:hypothetical protein
MKIINHMMPTISVDIHIVHKKYGLLNMHKYILKNNMKWLTNEHMSIAMQMIYIGHLKNQQ